VWFGSLRFIVCFLSLLDFTGKIHPSQKRNPKTWTMPFVTFLFHRNYLGKNHFKNKITKVN